MRVNFGGKEAVFVECSEFYKGVIIMAKKSHFESMCQLLLTLIVATSFEQHLYKTCLMPQSKK